MARLCGLLTGLLLCSAAAGSEPGPASGSAPDTRELVASIIIDDVGNNYHDGRAVVELPANLTIAILPGTSYAASLARLAARKDKEVMLHLPMQSVEHHQHSPGTLDLHMTRKEFARQLHHNLSSVPYVRGVNNHMGSLLTRHPGHMSWLMHELSRHGGLYFVDSKTTAKSIADRIALEYQIPSMSRDFFLDPDDDPQTLKTQFNRFIDKILKSGHALAIAHPYPATIAFLRDNLHRLEKHGIRLIPVSELIDNRYKVQQEETPYVACTGTTCSGL